MDERQTKITAGGALVVEWMDVRDIEAFFNVPGESFLTVLDALRDSDRIQNVTMRHEGGAAFAAEAYAKLSGNPAVCMATRGPGACNLSIGVQTAYYDGTPLLAFLGLIPRRLQGSGAFQEFDPTTMFTSFSKAVLTVNDPRVLLGTLDDALAIAIAERPGPVVVGLPVDVLTAIESFLVPAREAVDDLIQPLEPSISARMISKIRRARFPAVLVATEADRGAAATSIARLVEVESLSVFCAWRRFSAFSHSHPNFAGLIGPGMLPSVRRELDSIDFLLCFGYGLDQITCDEAHLDRPGLEIVQVSPASDVHIARRLREARYSHVPASPGIAAESLLSESGSGAHRVNSTGDQPYAAKKSRKVPIKSGLAMEAVMERIDQFMPDDAIVISDAGNFSQWMLRHVFLGKKRSFLGPQNGAMGYALPAAIGANLASPTRQCWVFTGDGGLIMSSADLVSAKRYASSVMVLVFDNGCYGTIRAKQEDLYPGRPSGTSLGGVDIAALARSSGWWSVTVKNRSDIVDALNSAANVRGCRLIHFLVDDLPLVPEDIPT